MKEVQLFERALESIHTVPNVSVVSPSLQGQLVFIHGPLSVDEVCVVTNVVIGSTYRPIPWCFSSRRAVQLGTQLCGTCAYVHYV